MNLEQRIEATATGRRRALRDLGLFDANLWLGRPAFFPLARELAPREMGPLMEQFALEGALVSHWDSVHLSAQDGNGALQESGPGLREAAAGLPEGVFTIWTGLPTAIREQDPLPGFLRPDPGMRGVRLFPQTHHFSLSPWVVGDLCDWCIEHRLPVFLWHVEVRWQDLHALAVAFPGLDLVVETQWQKILYHMRDLAALLRSCPNVLLETSNFIGQDHVSQFVRSFGSGRLLFGSFLPVNDPFTSIGMILDADIGEDDKAAIAGGNLRRLVGEVRA